MSDIDLTLVVTVHDETLVSGPTMASADRAVGGPRMAGHASRRSSPSTRPPPRRPSTSSQA